MVEHFISYRELYEHFLKLAVSEGYITAYM